MSDNAAPSVSRPYGKIRQVGRRWFIVWVVDNAPYGTGERHVESWEVPISRRWARWKARRELRKYVYKRRVAQEQPEIITLKEKR